MATMQGSGVSVIENDQSFASFDTINLSFMIPMMTKRGQVGNLNEVSISDFKSILGYDLAYNGNYLGLASILGATTKAQVLRINEGASYGNVVVFQDGSSYSVADVADIDVLEAAVCLRDRDFVAPALSGSFDLTEAVVPGTLRVYVGATLVAHDNGTTGTFVSDNAICTSGAVTYSTGAGSLVFTGVPPISYSIQYTHAANVAMVIAMESPGDWDALAIRMSRYFEVQESFASTASVSVVLTNPIESVGGAYKLKDMDGIELAISGVPAAGVANITGTGVTGTLTFATRTVALTFDVGTFPAAKYPMLLNHNYIQDDTYYLFEVLRKVTVGDTSGYVVAESQKISLSSSLDNYVGEATFANVVVRPITATPLLVSDVGVSAPLDLLYGTDGDFPASALNLSFTDIDSTRFNMICMNGLLGASFVSAFIAAYKDKKKVVLFDVPNVKTAISAKAYCDSVVASESAMAYWVSDLRTIGTKEYSIYPSVKAALAYAAMFKATGYLNYPPAGYQYGAVVAEKLLETNASENGAFLKQNKINYLAMKSAGAVIWEHRTRYAFESDLSYASTVVTLYALESRCRSFADNFPFRYVTAELLVLLKNGLEDIMADYLQKGFLWSGDIVLPTFSEVKKSGARFMDIYCNVKFAEDGQEFTFNFNIKATA